MKATYQIKHCGGKREANHADRTFDVSKAKNIKSIEDDRAYVYDGEKFRIMRTWVLSMMFLDRLSKVKHYKNPGSLEKWAKIKSR